MLVLEELEHAERRGATIIAEVVGFASGFDRGRTGDGLARVVRQTLTAAGITPAELDHVNASAPGSVEEDAWEARGIRAAVGEVPVVAFKPNLSHLGAGSDAADFAVSLLAMRHGTLPGTLNHARPDSACPVVVNRESRAVCGRYVVKTGGTEMGQCAAVVVRRWG